MVIHDRMEAINPNGQLKQTTKPLQTPINKLSNGVKTEFSISEKTKRKSQMLSQAAESAEDGVSLAQIADGAMSKIQDVLNRGMEVSVKAANGTLSDFDRNALQKEIAELRNQIDGIREQTKFNEIYVLKGNAYYNQSQYPTVENPEEEYARIELPSISSSSLGLDDLDVAGSPEGSAAALRAFRDASDHVSEERDRLGAYQSRLADSISGLDTFDGNAYAEEMVKSSNTNIVDQAGQSMLAQANQSNQDVLALIG
jgi:flagellin